MKKILLALVGLAIVASLVVTAVRRSDAGPKPIEALRQTYRTKTKPSVDHALFAQLKGPFGEAAAGDRGLHLLPQRAAHRGDGLHPLELGARPSTSRARESGTIGKKNVLNNFCIGVAGSQQSCNKCHAGYGWADAELRLQRPLNVDCLACHDNSGDLRQGGRRGRACPPTASTWRSVAQQRRAPAADELRHLPLLRRRRQQREARRPRDGAVRHRRATWTSTWATDGADMSMRRLPHRREAPDARQDLLALLDEPQPRRRARAATERSRTRTTS